jgi:hypothetical protein
VQHAVTSRLDLILPVYGDNPTQIRNNPGDTLVAKALRCRTPAFRMGHCCTAATTSGLVHNSFGHDSPVTPPPTLRRPAARDHHQAVYKIRLATPRSLLCFTRSEPATSAMSRRTELSPSCALNLRHHDQLLTLRPAITAPFHRRSRTRQPDKGG